MRNRIGQRAERGVARGSSPVMGVAVWALVIGVFLGYQGFCLLSDDDRWPPITEIFRDVIRYPVGRWVLFGLWLWLGWHLFIRTLFAPYQG
jgi:Family of unknown function (DUF6186)